MITPGKVKEYHQNEEFKKLLLKKAVVIKAVNAGGDRVYITLTMC